MQSFKIRRKEDNTTDIFTVCRMCGNTKTLSVPSYALDSWLKGQLIQSALPMLSPADRELLISGTCGPCFDKLFEDNLT